MPKYNLTTCTEKTKSTSLFTGNPISNHIHNSLNDLFNEEEIYMFDDSLFEQRYLLSQAEFDSRVEDWQDI